MTSTTPDWETEVANAMGPNPGGFFCRLSDEVAFLHYTWQQCCSLFVADRPGRDVLMGAAPAAFGLLEYVMRDYILLQICRLTDPATW